ncbi:MAG: phage late control D family protein [Deltaproteobacteria bacterium]|nr:phage late control D family protein [Deltaproteobacteria bacterium]
MANQSAIPIYEGQDFYVPYFEVKLQERALAKDVVRDILQVTYKDNIEEIDSFEISINNWDAHKRRFKYVDEQLFDPGKKIELWMGYYGQDRLRLMLKGEITSLRPAFPAGGQPTLAISGLNVLHRLRTKQESQAYERLTDSGIAKQIGGRLGIAVRTAGTNEEEYPYLFQDNQYDIVFLMERARRIGYDLLVEEKGEGGRSEETSLYFGPSDTVQHTTYRLTYGRSLIEFQPTLTTANQVGEVTVRGWDPVHKKKIEVTVKRSELSTRGVGERGGQAAIEQSFNQKKEIVATKPVHSEQEAKTLAKETLERIAKDMVKGSGSTVGLPDLRAGTVVEIDGLGDRFSGRYFVTATSHAIGDSGYTTQFECRREET